MYVFIIRNFKYTEIYREKQDQSYTFYPCKDVENYILYSKEQIFGPDITDILFSIPLEHISLFVPLI